MTTNEKLEILTNAINDTERLSGEDFNKHPGALYAYQVLFGEEALNKMLAAKQDLHLNRFYSPDWLFQTFVEENNIHTLQVKKQIDRLENTYTRNWLLIDLIKKAINRNELELAENFIAELPDEDSGPARYAGHRIMLKYAAETGDLAAFKFRIKPAKPARFPRNEVTRYKHLLVENYAKKNGWQKGVELCNDKVLGEQFAITSIRWTIHQMSLDQIDAILTSYPIFLKISPHAKADFYVCHFANTGQTAISDDDFKRAITEVMKVDKDIKAGDGRLRDFLLCNLGAATTNKSQTLECKKLIISPFYKRELSAFLKNKEQ